MADVFGLRVFDIGELFAADQSLRGRARTVREAASDLRVDTGGLPPEAQSIVATADALRGRLTRAADSLAEAASALGQTGADAKHADNPGPLTITKALLSLASGELPDVVLRRYGRRRIDGLRGDLRRHTRRLTDLRDAQEAARRAGNTRRAGLLQHTIDRREALHKEAVDALREARGDLRTLREKGHINKLDERTLRLLKELSDASGFKLAGGIFTVRDWHKARGAAGSWRGAIEHRARAEHDARRLPETDEARRTAGGPVAKKLLKAAPVLGGLADAKDAYTKARKAFEDPNAGNIAKATAAGLHAAGNVPGIGLLPDGAAYAIEGGVFLTDHANDVKNAAGDVVGAGKNLVKKIF
jgi:hypothetical protein